MATKQNDKDQLQKKDTQSNTEAESQKIENQDDQLELDSDMEMEGLVDSIAKKEESMKKN